jgi:hypothetical protein
MSMAAKIPDPEEQAAEAAKYGYFDHEKMVLTRNGIWLADGEEISHEPTRRLFAKSLHHDSKGYFLYIGHETKRIEVEDTAYFVQRIEHHGKRIEVWLSDDTREPLDFATLIYSPGRLTCKIKQGKEEAKFLSVPYNELLKDLDEDEAGYFLRNGGNRVVLAKK